MIRTEVLKSAWSSAIVCPCSNGIFTNRRSAMRTFYKTFTRLTAAALLVAMSAAPGFAAKATPATDKNTNVPAVPRAIPDLVPYHKFDPPAGAVFDASKLTISGDMRIRPEFRSKGGFGVSGTPGNANGNFTNANNQSSFFTQQWIRLGFHYAISPDVAFFMQPQVSNNFGLTMAEGEALTPIVQIRTCSFVRGSC